MKNESCVIGVDFGTLSARAVVASVNDGTVLAESVYEYPHGVITGALPSGASLPDDWALADPADYREALFSSLRSVVEKSGVCPEKIIAIGIDATTYTMVPCLADGTCLAERREFAEEPMAWIKLWKHHGAVSQAEKIASVHAAYGGFPAIERYGGSVNCEWALPKLLETYENAPEVAAHTDRFCDLGEWLARLLTGRFVNSIYSAGFKCMWTPESGWPSDAALDMLSPGFASFCREKFEGEITDFRHPCGVLTRSAAEAIGLPEGIPVAAPVGDGSAPGVYFCTSDSGALAITLGTSVAMAFVSDVFRPLKGLNGVVKDGIVSGFYSYDAGQPCAGDMLDWYVRNQVPQSYDEAAKTEGRNIHAYLAGLAEESRPYDNPLTVLDWFNGNRSILNNASLRGCIFGLSVQTRPEEIYCAMVQAIACGMRVILDHLASGGITFSKIIICGGMAEKNEFIRRQYASVLGREVYLSSARNITALSSCMLAAIAAGISPEEAATDMGCREFLRVLPDEAHKAQYDAIYGRYKKYHDLLGNFQV